MRRNAVAWAALVVSTAALISSRGMTRPVPAAPQIPAEGKKTAEALSQAFGAVADFVKPSVVQISVQRKASTPRMLRRGDTPPGGPPGNVDPKDFEEMLKRFFPDFKFEKEQFGLAEGTGSGFVYDDRGHILTNNHVVEGAEKLVVTFYDGTEAPAKVIGTDPGSDVAVIKVETTDQRPVLIGQSGDLKVGEWVLAVGSPFGLNQTVTSGIVSATERNNVGINDFEAFIQTDAAINPGNSGGPLVDMDGRVVGINSAIVTGTRSNSGVGFAIPIDMATNLADKLIKDGKVTRARLGVAMQPVTPALAKQLGLDPKTKGILVNQVVDGSPADKAGLKQGDVIIGFAGEDILNQASFRIKVASSDIGKTYKLTYFREGKEYETEVTLAPQDEVVFDIERDQAKPETPEKPDAPKVELEGFGFEVEPLTAPLAKQFGYEADVKGLIVSSVKDASPAQAAGLSEGDVITKVVADKKLQPVTGLEDFKALSAQSDELAIYALSPNGVGRFITLSKPAKP